MSIVAFLFLAYLASAPQSQRAAPPITIDELNQRSVVGHLGKPLGTVVEIQAEVVSGDTLGLKMYRSSYLLKATHVDGQKLKQPVTMPFLLRSLADGLATDPFKLHILKTGQKASSLDSEAIRKLEEGYVGKQVRLAAFEVGMFEGLPRNLPKDAAIWADSSFGFRSYLIVVVNRTEKK